MKISFTPFYFLIAFLFQSNVGAEQIEQPHKYTEAKIIKRGPPGYPIQEASRSSEGWVDLIFTVTKEAQVKDIEVSGHSGVEGFVRPAIKAVAKYIYEPAKLNGEPVDSTQEIRVTFMMQSSPRGANRKFVRNFKKFSKALTEGEHEVASEYIIKLRELKSDNLYENAFLNLAEYYYGVLINDKPTSQINRLSAATRVEGRRPYIPAETWVNAMQAKFYLQVKTADYGAALKTFSKIPDKKKFASVKSALLPVVNKIDDLKTNELSFSTTIKLSHRGFAGLRLIKPVFSVSDLKGEIERIRLSCDSGIQGLTFVKNAEFRIPKSFGDCYLEIKGSPGSSFKLLQLPVLETDEDL